MTGRISFIGAGNVAFRFSLALQEKGYCIHKIYNRSEDSRGKIIKALRTNGAPTSAADSICDLFDSDLVIISVADDAIAPIVDEIAQAIDLYRNTEGHQHHIPSFVHTSGATDIDVFGPLIERDIQCGVLYPLMTLKKNKNLDFKHVPMLLESTDKELSILLDSIATDLGSEHYFKSSEERLRMHVAAVFTCNFVNYVLGLSLPIVQRDYPLLLPSTIEAVRNAFLHTPDSTLTGPARRGDMETIEKHISLLEKLNLSEQEEFYRLFTEKILNKYKK